jgi:hypothetical protein
MNSARKRAGVQKWSRLQFLNGFVFEADGGRRFGAAGQAWWEDFKGREFEGDGVYVVFAVVADVVFGAGFAGFGSGGSGFGGGFGFFVHDVVFIVVVREDIDGIGAEFAGSDVEVLQIGDGELHGVEEGGGGALVDAAVEQGVGDFGDVDLDGFGVFEGGQFDIDGVGVGKAGAATIAFGGFVMVETVSTTAESVRAAGFAVGLDIEARTIAFHLDLKKELSVISEVKSENRIKRAGKAKGRPWAA